MAILLKGWGKRGAVGSRSDVAIESGYGEKASEYYLKSTVQEWQVSSIRVCLPLVSPTLLVKWRGATSPTPVVLLLNPGP